MEQDHPDQREAGGLTRRRMLGGAAAAGAAAMLPSSTARAASGSAPAGASGLFSLWVGEVRGHSRPLRTSRRFSTVGVEWAAPTGARIELRTREPGRPWGGWVPAAISGHAPDHPGRGRGTSVGEALWAGRAELVQLRSDRLLAGVRLHFVAAEPPQALAAAAASPPPLATPVLYAGSGQPPIIARRVWSHGRALPREAPAFGTVELAFVHHTENPNGYGEPDVPSLLRGIYVFHRYVRGWNDIGYNFVIDLYGRIWEARFGGIQQAVVGAQAGGYNLYSTGVAILGSFVNTVPTSAALQALEELLAWKLSLHGRPALGHVVVRVDPTSYQYTPYGPNTPVSLPRIAGHRDGDSTDCPGDALYAQLPTVRRRVSGMTGTPLSLTITGPAAPSPPRNFTFTGKLTQLDGTPVAGAQVLLQSYAAPVSTTLATTATDSTGTWSASVALEESRLMQALHPGQPVAISDLLDVEIAPILKLQLDSWRPLVVSGAVWPPKPHVLVELVAVHGKRRVVIDHRQVKVTGARFRTSLRPHGPGTYIVRASTPLDAQNAAGHAIPLQVDIPSGGGSSGSGGGSSATGSSPSGGASSA